MCVCVYVMCKVCIWFKVGSQLNWLATIVGYDKGWTRSWIHCFELLLCIIWRKVTVFPTKIMKLFAAELDTCGCAWKVVFLSMNVVFHKTANAQLWPGCLNVSLNISDIRRIDHVVTTAERQEWRQNGGGGGGGEINMPNLCPRHNAFLADEPRVRRAVDRFAN